MASFEERLERLQREVHPLFSEEMVRTLLAAEEQLFQRPRDIVEAINARLDSKLSYRANPARIYALSDLVSQLNIAEGEIAGTDSAPNGVPAIDWEELGQKECLIHSKAENFVRAAIRVFQEINDGTVQDNNFLVRVMRLYLRDTGSKLKSVGIRDVDLTRGHQFIESEIQEVLLAEYCASDFIVARMIDEGLTGVPEYRHRLLELNKPELLSADLLLPSRDPKPEEYYRAMKLIATLFQREAIKQLDEINGTLIEFRLNQLANSRSELPTIRDNLEAKQVKAELASQKYVFLSTLIDEEKEYIMQWFEEE